MATQPPPASPRTRGSVDDTGVFDDAKTYYTADERHTINRAGPRTRTYSQVSHPSGSRSQLLTGCTLQNSLAKQFERLGLKEPYRRGSHGMCDSMLHASRIVPSLGRTNSIYQMNLPSHTPVGS